MSHLVDVHAHFVTDSYVAQARAGGHEHPDGMPSWPQWTVEDHLALMDHGNIGTSMLSISTPGVHFGDDAAARRLAREVNEFGAGVVAAHPDRFGFFAALPLPDVDGARAEAAYGLDTLGADGVAITSNAHGQYPGDARLAPLLAELNERAAVVFVHPTSPPNWEAVSLGRPRPLIEFLFDSGRCVSDLIFADVLTRYPRIEWIFTHGGGVLPLLADRIEMFRTLFPAYRGADGSGTVREQLTQLWFDTAGSPFPSQVPTLVDLVGTGKVLYGSDYCWTPAVGVAKQIESVDAAPAPPGTSDWRTLTTGNAERLFPRLAKGATTS